MSFGATVERVRNAPPGSSFGGAFTFGNLWVGSSSGGGGISVVCAVDPPNTYGAGGATNLWTLEFGDGSSVEFNIMKNQTVWIDKQHRVTFLGPVLDKDDVALMRSHGDDMKVTISSPDELLALVKKLKAEQATSDGPAGERFIILSKGMNDAKAAKFTCPKWGVLLCCSNYYTSSLG